MFNIQQTINTTRATLRAWSLEDSSGEKRASGSSERQPPTKKKVKDDSGNSCASTSSALEEYRKLYEETERLQRVVAWLKVEYEDAKKYEMFRRYRRLKGMVKRTLMYVRLGTVPDDIAGAIGLGQLMLVSAGVSTRRSTTPAKGVSGGAALDTPRPALLPEKTKELRLKATQMHSSIETMERAYEASKQYMSVQRYRLMKAMIKQMIRDCQP